MCSFGLAPSTLSVVAPRPVVEGRPVATITDVAPGANIAPFGMCQSLANPMVAAATAAALGVLTPMPCVPVVPAPWIPLAPQTMPSASFGSNQLDFGGIIPPASATSMRSPIRVG